jgi:putative transposase
MKDNPYASHWVDAVIRTAYSIMENWRKRYLKGRARKIKPKIRRRYARCKITLMKIDYEARTIRITLKQENISQYPGDQRGSSTGLEAGLLARL